MDWTSIVVMFVSVIGVVGSGIGWMLRIASNMATTTARIEGAVETINTKIENIEENCKNERCNRDRVWERLDEHGREMSGMKSDIAILKVKSGMGE